MIRIKRYLTRAPLDNRLTPIWYVERQRKLFGLLPRWEFLVRFNDQRKAIDWCDNEYSYTKEQFYYEMW